MGHQNSLGPDYLGPLTFRAGLGRGGPGLNVGRPKWAGPNKVWRPMGRARPKNQRAGPGWALKIGPVQE